MSTNLNSWRTSIKKLYYRFQYFAGAILISMLGVLSKPVKRAIATILGFFLFFKNRRQRLSLYNLRAAFPNKSDREIRKIGRGSLTGMVHFFFEFINIPRIAKSPEKFIETQGEEFVWEALNGGKGLILIVSHFGNWELMAVAAAAKGIPIHAIGKAVKNPLIYNYIKKLRGATGLRSIDRRGAVKKTIELLKNNQVIAVLLDAHAKEGAVDVNFFGRKAATYRFPAMLALKYGTPVMSTFYYREHKKRSVLVFNKPFHLIKTGNFQADVISNTQQYVSALEREIRKRPEDWNQWMHNRWKHDE